MKQIAELGEIEYIENLPLLRILNLLKNPIQVRDHLPREGMRASWNSSSRSAFDKERQDVSAVSSSSFSVS